MHFDAIWHTSNATSSDSVIQASALSGLLHVIALRGKRLKCAVEDRHKYEPTSCKSHVEILTLE